MAALLAAVIAVAADFSSGRGRPRHAAVQATNHSPSGRQHTAGAFPQHAALGQAAAVDRVLSYTAYVKLAGHARRDVALTFDDGPSPYTPQVLSILRRMHAVATFFVIGREARAYPHLVADEARAGNEVGDHTEDHPPLDELSASAQTAQITDAAQAIHEAGAPYPVVMRPPYGAFNATTLQILRQQRMLMVLWSADTSDYARPGRTKIVYTGISGGQPGAIILMHDGGGDRSETVAALPRIITRLRQRGFKLVTVSQLVGEDPPPRDQPPPTPLSGGL
jgi:peptidoglycan-N-acetylglucosamine deacetylase